MSSGKLNDDSGMHFESSEEGANSKSSSGTAKSNARHWHIRMRNRQRPCIQQFRLFWLQSDKTEAKRKLHNKRWNNSKLRRPSTTASTTSNSVTSLKVYTTNIIPKKKIDVSAIVSEYYLVTGGTTYDVLATK
ncbi:hypothetical protein CHS0354_033089 [Potamilus streckersoni]|uniref:Uncharacterized protein n=1 Tax=Potamilus streckersoni TaxID=2493646 RepID=A0AAE0RZF9_9BIVA|nr:hypothetical protein CHS0354_033089 [Potamilus streckersoni]